MNLVPTHEGGLISQDKVMDFILAGKAVFTVKSIQTGVRFTYKVQAPRQNSKETTPVLWVSVLTGTDNNSCYSYIGFISKNQNRHWIFSHGGRKSNIAINAKSVVAFTFFFNAVWAVGRFSNNLEFWHEGKCCRCGKRLTDPESIARGIGPECAGIKAKHHHS